MAKKTLNEATIRRFQKLAKVAPLTENYYGRDDIREEEEEEIAGDELAADAEMEADAEMDAEMDAEEADAEEADAGLELTEEEAQAIIELGEKLSEALPASEDTELAPVDAEADEMADDAMADAEEEEDLMEALAGISYIPSKSEIVNEVAQRVARRLKAAKLHEAKLNRALGRK